MKCYNVLSFKPDTKLAKSGCESRLLRKDIDRLRKGFGTVLIMIKGSSLKIPNTVLSPTPESF